jgi:hypothetical protein
VAQVRNVKPGHAVIHPNRDKWSCKVTRLIIVAILLGSAALMLTLTIGGWSKLQGLKPVDFVTIALYVIFAIYIFRWTRGLLPIAAGLAILLLIIVVIAALGAAGTSWFQRSHAGFGPAQSLFGGKGLGADVLGTVTVVLIPVSVALIVLALVGFAQGWNVETEVTAEEADKRGSKIVARGPGEATA